jgi:Protein of unknown function (DUF2934)
MAKKNRAARRGRARTALALPRRRRAAPATLAAPPPAPVTLGPPPAPVTGTPPPTPEEPPPTPEEPPPTPVTHEQIALRAYELHRSGAEGDALAHWLAAERELLKS